MCGRIAAGADSPDGALAGPVDSGARALVVAQAGAADAESTTPTAESQSAKLPFREIRDRIPSTTDTVPLARVDDRIVTNQVLRRWLELAKPTRYVQLSVEAILDLPPADLASVLRALSFYEMARREAVRDEDFVSTPLPALLRNQKHAILRERFFEKQVDEKHEPLNEEEARRYYQRNLNDYTQPFRFTARSIFLSTYRPYVLKRNETPPSIARDVLGDPTAMNRILDPRTSAPLFRPLHPDAVEDFLTLRPGNGYPPSLIELRFLPPPPLREGQIVMIPMGDDERAKVKARMEDLVQQIREGGDFVEAAKAHSDEPAERRGQRIGPLPAPGRPLLDAVIEAAYDTPVGEITPILETPHGYLVLRIEEKTDELVQPFEEVRETLIATELKERRTRARKELEVEIFQDPALEIDDAIMEDDAPDSRVIARVGDFEYTWGQYKQDTDRRYSFPPSRKAREDLLTKSERLREEIINYKALAMGLEGDPEVAARLDDVEMIFRGRAYRDWYARNRVKISEAQLRQFYNDHLDQFRPPGQYRLIELVLRLEPEKARDPKEIETMKEYLRSSRFERIRSHRQFAREARREGNWPPNESERGETRWVAENYRGPEFAPTLAELEEGSVSGPFHQGQDVFLVWLRDRKQPSAPPFPDVRDEVERRYRRQNWTELLEATEEAIRSDHEFELLFTYDEQE